MLQVNSKSWLITGVAGFIGSHLAVKLLKSNQQVVGLDNFATGSSANIQAIQKTVGDDLFYKNFRLIEGDICDRNICAEAVKGCNLILHQAALGSIPRSIDHPLDTHQANVDGFVNLVLAARDAGIKRFVYASSSSVYGSSKTLPKREGEEGLVLSPYALSKKVNEDYARVYAHHYGMQIVGLRYFNVFGARQSPDGAYAAVIPRWLQAVKDGQQISIFGDGSFSRDFCYVDNAVQANILAATVDLGSEISPVFNISCGERTDLNTLWKLITEYADDLGIKSYIKEPKYLPERLGDVPHSQGDISRAEKILGYKPTHYFAEGLRQTVGDFFA
jgi:UDP-N-acetylglucosamine 4-epimerase